jgi:hypothetical protein
VPPFSLGCCPNCECESRFRVIQRSADSRSAPVSSWVFAVEDDAVGAVPLLEDLEAFVDLEPEIGFFPLSPVLDAVRITDAGDGAGREDRRRRNVVKKILSRGP